VRLAAPAAVTVRLSAARVKGELQMKAPKSAKSRRTVPLIPEAAEALKEYRKSQPAAISGLVFPMHPRADWQDWQNLLADLGLPHYRVHDLRHGFATMLLEGGTDRRVVQDLLGWSTASMAEVYQHVRPVLKQSAVDDLGRALRRGL
jgi:integrase